MLSSLSFVDLSGAIPTQPASMLNFLLKNCLPALCLSQTQEFSCLAWSRSGLYLAIGTAKGNLMMYNSREKKKVPYVGKHTKKIVTAVWNKDNLLALTSLDRTVGGLHVSVDFGQNTDRRRCAGVESWADKHVMVNEYATSTAWVGQ